MRNLLLTLAFLTVATFLFGQSKSEIKELNIRSTTVWNYDYSTGKEVKKMESYTKFNNAGLVIESAEYDKAGKLKEHIVYTYDENNNVTEEKFFDESNKLVKTYKYTYKNNLRFSKEKYDAGGKLEWKKIYSYEM
jgi:hypothetical protein